MSMIHVYDPHPKREKCTQSNIMPTTTYMWIIFAEQVDEVFWRSLHYLEIDLHDSTSLTADDMTRTTAEGGKAGTDDKPPT